MMKVCYKTVLLIWFLLQAPSSKVATIYVLNIWKYSTAARTRQRKVGSQQLWADCLLRWFPMERFQLLFQCGGQDQLMKIGKIQVHQLLFKRLKVMNLAMWWWYIIVILYIPGARDKKTATIKISEKWLIVFVGLRSNSDIQEAARKGICWFVWRAPLLPLSKWIYGYKVSKTPKDKTCQKTVKSKTTVLQMLAAKHPQIHCLQSTFIQFNKSSWEGERPKGFGAKPAHIFFLCNFSHFSLNFWK